jgi:hypothetical protein
MELFDKGTTMEQDHVLEMKYTKRAKTMDEKAVVISGGGILYSTKQNSNLVSVAQHAKEILHSNRYSLPLSVIHLKLEALCLQTSSQPKHIVTTG